MKTLYESILDTNKESAEKVGNALFFPYFAECFVKVFGKIERDIVSLDKRRDAPQLIGNIKTENWKYNGTNKNEFVDRLHKMIDMLKKKYPKLVWGIDFHTQLVVQDIWKVYYTVHFKLREYEFNWRIDLLHNSDKIKKVVIFYLHTRALKNRELLKLIDDNI